jgi:hypothetical protein
MSCCAVSCRVVFDNIYFDVPRSSKEIFVVLLNITGALSYIAGATALCGLFTRFISFTFSAFASEVISNGRRKMKSSLRCVKRSCDILVRCCFSLLCVHITPPSPQCFYYFTCAVLKLGIAPVRFVPKTFVWSLAALLHIPPPLPNTISGILGSNGE